MALRLLTIISGGQTGVDQVGLCVARELGYPTGGTAPKGWKTDAGPAPWLADYGLVECRFNGYRPRTIQNVNSADATVWFGVVSAGYRCTKSAVDRAMDRRPYRWIENPSADALRSELQTYAIRILNIAGNRLRTNPQASVQARVVLTETLAAYGPAR